MNASTLRLVGTQPVAAGAPDFRDVTLPPRTTVRVGGHTFYIPSGGTRAVLWDGDYEIVSYDRDPRPLRARVAARLHRWADRIGGVR